MAPATQAPTRPSSLPSPTAMTAKTWPSTPSQGNVEVDLDSDGFLNCGGDCNDADASINPDATDIFGDGIDSNCDGVDGCPRQRWRYRQ